MIAPGMVAAATNTGTGGCSKTAAQRSPALLAWITIGLVLAMRLSLLEKWGSPQAQGPLLPEAGTAAQAAALLEATAGVQGMAPTRLLRQAAAQAAARSAGAALLRDRDSGGAGTGGNSAVAPDVTSSPSPQQTVQAGASVLAEPPRVSPWADKLSEAELGGGWNLTWEVFDRAARHPNATVVSWSSPRVLLIRDFLTPDETEHLIRQATGGFARSEVVAEESKQHEARTSYGSWLNGAKRDDKVLEIQNRIHRLVGIPEAFGESIYVLQYSDGQKYDPHTDHCASSPAAASTQSCQDFLRRGGGPKCGPGGGGVTCGDRLATFILYLRSPTRGGATVFPLAPSYRMHSLQPQHGGQALDQQPGGQAAQGAEQAQQGGEGTSAESGSSGDRSSGAADSRRLLRHGDGQLSGSAADTVPPYCQEGATALQVAPPSGSAVFFWDYVPAGSAWQPGDLATPDPASLHGGCPVLDGTKLIATRWMRSAEFY
ncbi:hypothetical protein CHLNCDRAFT_135671 [Chlorella variabilis]|uniref:Fe2OG dioxygenase domain-containing protein n=1 Tax=Chlorella variabilis TaxID=554065 RepID=E1ZIQ8_CHLVA|nr:hypothetical protein CHLNCDRAFT_135671 [Chlorella variabilis]EFN54375.1 hypothetical protein CHLNCDRAFT_135671 [Chlorella variabilis]|eukprot:XP_005846477.1 hypothetical protein CHLNCDRAFT_135671 [Chlorella variabilis]